MGRECNDAPGPFDFRGCDLTAEYLPATEEVRMRFPATAPIETPHSKSQAPEKLQISNSKRGYRDLVRGGHQLVQDRSPKPVGFGAAPKLRAMFKSQI